MALLKTDTLRRGRTTNFAAGLLAAALATAGCGGGSEIAPSNPVVVGTGMAEVVLDGTAFPETQLVRAIVGEASLLPTTITGEVVTFTTDTALLAHRSLAGAVTVTGPGGAPTFREDNEYTVDRTAGAITRTGTSTPTMPPATPEPGPIAAGATVEVTYTYNKRLLAVTVGVTISEGQDASVTVYNLEPPTGGPVVVTAVASAAPSDGSLAFDAGLQTNLAEFSGRGLFQVLPSCSTSTDPLDCPAQNEVTITSFDLTNELNPCISGSLRATVRNIADPDPANRSILEITFSDPDC